MRTSEAMSTTPRRSLQSTDPDNNTKDFLWQAANEMHETTPTISRHLAASLVAQVPDDGMSAYAKRMHCNKCASLMTTSQVRIRKAKKRAKVAGTFCKNGVNRTCTFCGKVNIEAGTERGVRPTLEEDSIVIGLRRKAERKKRKSEQRSKDMAQNSTERNQEHKVMPVISKKRKSGKKSKNKSKQLARKKGSGQTTQNKKPTTGLAASFLFEPL